jgi:hypothetical protein
MRKWAVGGANPAPDSILITGGARLSIETLVNIQNLRKNNTGFDGGILE